MTRHFMTLALLLTFLSGCATTEPARPATGDSPKEPAVTTSRTLDIDGAQKVSTLELLETQSGELAALKTRLLDAEKSIEAAGIEVEKANTKAEKNAAEQQRLRGLLDSTTEEKSALNEALISARIRELRLEQKMLEARLAELTAGGGS